MSRAQDLNEKVRENIVAHVEKMGEGHHGYVTACQHYTRVPGATKGQITTMEKRSE